MGAREQARCRKGKDTRAKGRAKPIEGKGRNRTLDAPQKSWCQMLKGRRLFAPEAEEKANRRAGLLEEGR